MKHIVYFHTHDTGRGISPYGYALDTPNLAKLARDGALFRQAFDCGPTCSPARAALLTGQYPHQCDMLGLAHRGFELNDRSKHLANFLKRNGYHTVLSGIQHVTTQAPELLGYDEFSPPIPGDSLAIDRANTATACSFLARKHEQPFFLSLGLFATHRPYPETPDAEDDPDFMKPPVPIPDTPECRRDWAAFATLVRHADRCFGQVLETIGRCGLQDETLILATTDHGVAFPGMKCNLNDHGCGVLFILRIPGVGNGTVSDALVSQLDFYPTVCEWAGLEPPEWLEGVSLCPLLRGEKETLHDAVFAELNFHAARDVQRTVRTDRFRYVRRFDPYPGTVLPNIDDGLTKRFLNREADLRHRPRTPEEQLFDLYLDPAECRSVFDDPAYASVLAKLRGRLSEWMAATGDPLLAGPLPTPPGALLNSQDGLEPDDGNREQR